LLSEKDKASFQDILESVNWIERFIAEKTFDQYLADYEKRSAIERQVSIISEASVRLGETAEMLCPSIPWNNIRGIGNHIRHAYDFIDPMIIWKAVTNDLPALKAAVEAILTAQ
jgi:uncharacterized protein with HEPN domain